MNLIAQDTAQALPLTAWLEVLSAVFPPRGVVVVGAGTGQGPWVQWLRSRRVRQVCLVEGDETQYWHLQRHVPEGCEWSLRRDVVAAQPGPTVFYRASNAVESGLIEPQRLRPLWPNLAQDAALEVEAPITLEALLADAGEQTNWLVLDCLPAAPLLEGAAARVSQLDVIAARVAASAQAGVDADALHPTVDAQLKSAGFVCVHTRAERHPALAHALYVRDPAALQAQWAQAHAQAAQRLSQVEALNRAMQATQQALEEARAEHAQQLQQAQQKAQERERQWQHDMENLRAAAAVAEQARAELQTQLEGLHFRLVQSERALSSAQQSLHEAQRNSLAAAEDCKRNQEVLEAQIVALNHQIEKLKKDAQPFAGIFALTGRVNHLPVVLAMNTSHPDWLRVEGDDVEYAAENGKPLYVLSKDDGDFNVASKKPQLLIEPEVEYIYSGRVVHRGDTPPQAWIFQYDHEKRIAAHSLGVDEAGYFRLNFKTLPASRSVVVGLRLAGLGRIHGASSYLHLFEKADASSIQKLEARLRDLEGRQQREIANAVLQIESFIRLQHYLGPDILVPEMHHWPVSPDFGLLLVELIESNDYDAVVEFGSGTSTLLLAKAIERVAHRHRRGSAPLLSFEHLEVYQQKTQGLLDKAGLAQYARVELTPLSDWHRRDGRAFAYYSCDAALDALRQLLPTADGLVMVVVDGPPAATGPMARYPALPQILNSFGPSFRFHFLMDDYLRTDEQEIIKAWEMELAEKGLKFKRTELHQLEKKACLLEVWSADEKNETKGSK